MKPIEQRAITLPLAVTGKAVLLLPLLMLLTGSWFAPPARAAGEVYVIDVHGPVWPGQAKFVTQALDKAAQDRAAAVVLDVDTFGGLAASATDIKDAILKHDADYPTVAYVHNRALSSGSLITLSCKTIAMAPGSTLGSAQPHPGGGGDPDPETLSWARKEFSSTAEYRKRDPNIALAWVTAQTAIPSLGIKEGDILTLTTDQAKAHGYCDVVVVGVPDILAYLHIAGAPVTPVHLDAWQSAAEWISEPWITALLLGLGLAAIIIEMMTLHSWGLAGVIGGLVVAAVFAAHIIAGTATWIGILLFLGGIALILFETHVFPGHGLWVLGGLICVFLGMFYALGGGTAGGLAPMLTAMFVTLGCIVAFFAYLPRSPVWRVLGHSMQQRAAAGYVAGGDFTAVLGRTGTTVSPLRPSGVVEVDGQRLTVVTEGAFLAPGTPIEIIRVQGSRIVVRETV